MERINKIQSFRINHNNRELKDLHSSLQVKHKEIIQILWAQMFEFSRIDSKLGRKTVIELIKV